MKYVVIDVKNDIVLLRPLFDSRLIEISIKSINLDICQTIMKEDILLYNPNSEQYTKKEDLTEIYKGSFIDVFDPKKYNIEDYKLIIILGEQEGLSNVDGELKSGQCLFIPFIEEEKESYGDRWIEHYVYLRYSLSRYSFGLSPSRFLEDLGHCKTGKEVLVLLSSLGHAVFYNQVYGDCLKAAYFMVTERMSQAQTNTIGTICQSLDNKSFEIGITYDNDGEVTFYGESGKYNFTTEKAALIIKQNIVFGKQMD